MHSEAISAVRAETALSNGLNSRNSGYGLINQTTSGRSQAARQRYRGSRIAELDYRSSPAVLR
jgi:hypothetical protein